MVKRFFAGKGLILLLGIIISILATSFTYYKMENAKKDLADYWLAKSCPSKENCRTKVEAKILKGQEKTTFVNILWKSGETTSNKSTAYFVLLSLDTDNTYEIEISTDPPSNGTPFDGGSVQIPTGRDSRFVEENFYNGKPVYVGVWHDQVIFLYLDTLIDISAPVIKLIPNINTQAAIAGISAPKTYEIALPTAIHPIFRQASTERNFFYTVSVCSLSLLILFSSLFGKNIEKIWQKTFNGGMKKQSLTDE